MKTTRILSSVAVSCCLLALVVCDASCSRPSVAGRTQSEIRTLSPNDAAQLAAKLANDKCERLYKRRPFSASQYAAVVRDGEYHWGGLDQGAPAGYSARAVF